MISSRQPGIYSDLFSKEASNSYPLMLQLPLVTFFVTHLTVHGKTITSFHTDFENHLHTEMCKDFLT